VSLDATQDQAKQNPVSNSSVARVLVLPSQEDQQIARHTGIIACQGFRA
jgi:hypothetical protein